METLIWLIVWNIECYSKCRVFYFNINRDSCMESCKRTRRSHEAEKEAYWLGAQGEDSNGKS